LDLIIKAVLALFLLGLGSLTATWALLKGLKPRWVVFSAAMTVALFFFLSYLLLRSNAPQDTPEFFSQFFEETWKRQVEALKEMHFTSDNIGMLKGFFQKYVFYSFPAWLAVACLLVGLVAYHLCASLLSRITPRVSKPMTFREWVVPEPLVFGLIVGAILKLFFKENSVPDLVGDNLMVFFVGLYSLGGLSIVSYFFNKWRLPAAVRMVSYLLILNLFFETVCLFGVMDVWFDFRKLKKMTREKPA